MSSLIGVSAYYVQMMFKMCVTDMVNTKCHNGTMFNTIHRIYVEHGSMLFLSTKYIPHDVYVLVHTL